jgi:hypothetical protein
MLFYQYNQLHSMQGTYSNPVVTSARYMQQPIDPQQQAYRTDQLVPQSSSQVTTPTQRSSPINTISTSSPTGRINNISLQNPDVLRSLFLTASNTKLDIASYIGANNSIGSITSAPPMTMSYESPKLHCHHHSKRHSSIDNHHQRRRLHSGSSCYESDSIEWSSDDEDKFEVKLKKTISSKRFLLTERKY